MASIKKNFVYSAILLSANYVIQLVIFPYISRTLGVTNYGICRFVDSIISYFVLFASMGMGTLGIREIAASKNDSNKLQKTFSNLLVLNSVTTIVAVLLLILCIHIVPKFQDYTQLLYIGVCKLIFNYMLIEWFFRGIEEFKFITIRSILVKVIYIVSIFIFVHEPEDYKIYYALTVSMIVLNAIINIIYSQKLVRIDFRNIDLLTYIWPFLTIGVYILMNSMYTSFNVAYLGFVTDDTQVGYYSTATKLYHIIIAVFGAFTGVMLPRMSSLVEEKKMVEFQVLFKKSTIIILGCSLPVIIFTIIFAPGIIAILSGPGYEGAILPMRIVMPLLFIIGYEQILVNQTLIPLKCDKTILVNSMIGAITGICLNVVLVPLYKSIGSAYVWVCCEILIMVLSQWAVTRKIKLYFDYKLLFKNIVVYIPLIVILFPFSLILKNAFVQVPIAALIMGLYTIFIQHLFFRKQVLDNMFVSSIKRLKSYL